MALFLHGTYYILPFTLLNLYFHLLTSGFRDPKHEHKIRELTTTTQH